MIQPWIQRYNQLPQWIRIVTAISGALIIVAIWYQYSFSHGVAERARLLEAHDKIEGHIKSVSGMTANSDRLLYEKHIVSTEDLSSLLSSLLQQSKDLELVSLEEIPVTLKDEVPEKVRGLHQVLEQKITATDIKLLLRGSYFSVLQYLHTIEQESGAGIFWKQLDYNVDEYPTADVQVVIRTIGTKAE